MKRVLLATTALGMGAGVAFAQDAMEMAPSIALSGDAEMGVVGSKDESARFHTDINVKFTLSGMTDGGVAFGSAIELAESGDGSNAVDDDNEHGGISIFMKGPFGNLEMGDTDGAFDWALSETNGVGGGSINDAEEHGAFSGNGGLDGIHDGQILRYDIAFSGFGFAASVELDDDIKATKTKAAQLDDGDPVFGVGGKYSMGMADGITVGVGVGYQMGSTGAAHADHPNQDMTILGGSVDIGTSYGLKAIANFSNESHEASAANDSSESKITRAGFGIGYASGPMEIGVNVGSVETDSPGTTDDRDVTGVGLAASYSLGGGAAIKFGVGTSETDNTDAGKADTDTNRWSLGVAFKF